MNVAIPPSATSKQPGHPIERVIDGRNAKIQLSVTAPKGSSKGIVVYVNGTAAPASYFDRMAAKLADEHGYTSYSISSRTGRIDPVTGLPATPGLVRDDLLEHVSTAPADYADDVARVVDLARLEHPNSPIAVVGTSLGGVIANYYNSTRNEHGVPVVSMSPVVLDQFLPFGDKLKLLASTVVRSLGESLVASPMSVGRPMSSEPDSPYNTSSTIHDVRVPTKVFRSVFEMGALTALRGPYSAKGHTTVVLAENDDVAWNPSSRALLPLWNRAANRNVVVAPGAPHELSQETGNQAVLDAIVGAMEHYQPAT